MRWAVSNSETTRILREPSPGRIANVEKESTEHVMSPLDLVKLRDLMNLTSGRSEVTVGLIDGPIVTDLPYLASENIRDVTGGLSGTCVSTSSAACAHGTLVASILFARRGSGAPGICPSCTLLLRPIFAEEKANQHALNDPAQPLPSSTPDELAEAIFDCVTHGARLINLSAALVQPVSNGERKLEESLVFAAKHGVIVVVAAGNQGAVGSSVIIRHPWVIPVAACNSLGRPLNYSNFGRSVGQRGLTAPGEDIPSFGPDGKLMTFGGTSAAAPFVTGAIALLWSEFPTATASEVIFSVTQAYTPRRTIVPPLLDGVASYELIKKNLRRRTT